MQQDLTVKNLHTVFFRNDVQISLLNLLYSLLWCSKIPGWRFSINHIYKQYIVIVYIPVQIWGFCNQPNLYLLGSYIHLKIEQSSKMLLYSVCLSWPYLINRMRENTYRYESKIRSFQSVLQFSSTYSSESYI